jgi:amidase
MDGVVTRTVRDTALALDVISGAMPGDPYYAPPPRRPFREEVGADPGSLRIGLCPALPGRPIHDECRAGVEKTGALLESLGHRVELAHPKAMEEDLLTPYFEVVAAHTAWELDGWERVIGRPWTEDDVEPGTWQAYQNGLALSGLDYVKGLTNLHAFSRRMAAWWADGFDVLVSPVLATPPPRLGFLIDLEHGWDRTVDIAQFTPQQNVTGQPAISLPLHWTVDRLPVGVHFVGPYAGEALLLRLAAQIEAAAPWHHRRPPTFAVE